VVPAKSRQNEFRQLEEMVLPEAEVKREEWPSESMKTKNAATTGVITQACPS